MRKEFTVEGDPFPQNLPGISKPWTLSSSVRAAVSRWGQGARVLGWAEWGPRGSGERMGLQESSLLPGAGAEAQTGFVQSHEGPARGNCARA